MKTIMLLVSIALTNFALPAWAADSTAPHDMSKMTMNPSKEDREKMAAAHTQMATCLRSDQDFKQCHDALPKECQSMMDGSCPEMEMGMGKGMHKGMKQKKQKFKVGPRPKNEQRRKSEMLEWIDGFYNPETFDPNFVNKHLLWNVF